MGLKGENEWGEYYMGDGKRGWSYELINRVNQAVPKFTDVFDEDTFYITAFIVVCATFVAAFAASKYLTIKPHQL